MSELVRALQDLLERERESALRADLDALGAIQVEKRAVLDELRDTDDEDTVVVSRLTATAQENLALLRQLTSVHRALAGVTPASYGADGRELVAAPSAERGAL